MLISWPVAWEDSLSTSPTSAYDIIDDTFLGTPGSLSSIHSYVPLMSPNSTVSCSLHESTNNGVLEGYTNKVPWLTLPSLA